MDRDLRTQLLICSEILEKTIEGLEQQNTTSFFGYPIESCPDDILEKYLKANENASTISPNYINLIEVDYELKRRSTLGIKIVNI